MEWSHAAEDVSWLKGATNVGKQQSASVLDQRQDASEQKHGDVMVLGGV